MPSDYEEAYRDQRSETQDCVVQAIAMVTGLSYLEVHEAFEIAGRKQTKGTSEETRNAALVHLGYEVRRIWTKQELALECGVPEPHLADLEGKDWLPRLAVRVNNADHVAPFWSGHVQDWSADTEAVIDEAWEIVKIGLPIRTRKPPPVIYL